MSPLKQVAILVALVIIGPAMYVFSRAHSLTLAFARIKVGDTADQVLHVMGKPDEGMAPEPAEYRYAAWPLPQEWVIHFSGGKVASKQGATP
jgi:hypothetical protein